MTEQTGEKRKADSDAEDVEEAGPGSPLRSRVGEDEDLRRVTTALRSRRQLCATRDHTILQLHSDSESDIIAEARDFEMAAMYLGGFDIDNAANREKITEWVREKACIYSWKTAKQVDWTNSVYMWAISITGSRREMVRTRAVGRFGDVGNEGSCRSQGSGRSL